MKRKLPELDVDYIGSQDPTLQPTAEDFAVISRFIQEQKQLRTAEAAAKQLAASRTTTRKVA